MKQLYYEDVEVGTEIPPLAKVGTTAMLVRWAGVSGDYNPLHYDLVFAKRHPVGGIAIYGALKRAWMAQMLNNWMGDEGFLKKIAAYYIGTDYPRHMKNINEPEEGETWQCKGKITRKYIKDGEHCVDCQIWVENGKGQVTTPGSATVILPSRG